MIRLVLVCVCGAQVRRRGLAAVTVQGLCSGGAPWQHTQGCSHPSTPHSPALFAGDKICSFLFSLKNLPCYIFLNPASSAFLLSPGLPSVCVIDVVPTVLPKLLPHLRTVLVIPRPPLLPVRLIGAVSSCSLIPPAAAFRLISL